MSWFRRAFQGAAASLGLVALPAAAQSVSPAAAPAAWLAYAESVNAEVAARLSGEDPRAVKLRTYLQARPADASRALPLRLWIDPVGTVTRIAFTRFPDAAANTALEALLTGWKFAAPRPRDLLLPLHLSIELAEPSGLII